MKEILILTEHRRGEIRDITFEMLTKGRELATNQGAHLVALILGHDNESLVSELIPRADKILTVENPRLTNFNSEVYQKVLKYIIQHRSPILTLIGHTSNGIDLAPSLAIDLGIPLVTDCIDVEIIDGSIKVTRQVYGGKINLEAKLIDANSHLITIRPATFESRDSDLSGEIEKIDLPFDIFPQGKIFVDYVEPTAGDVDISDAEIIISIGRGIKDEKNLSLIQTLAEAIKGEIGCSRPIVDKYWLSKNRQVGSSGKTVKPKLYIAIGISGSFQHIMGMKNSGLIVAINKDPKAPIFRIADYGIVDDLFKVIPPITQKINEFKQSDR
jgi:electron transfer flavoprotein alpha subunit